MKSAEIAFPTLIFAVTAGLLALGYFHYGYNWTTFAFPLGAGVALCALCALEIARACMGRANATGAADIETPPPFSLAAIGWLFALGAFLYGLGFLYGSAAYLLVCLRGNGFSWQTSLGTAAVALIAIWGLFIKAMGIQLPVIPPWLA
jgi:hypothetical protein